MLVSTQHSKKRFGMELVVGEPHSQSPTNPHNDLVIKIINALP